MPDDIDDLIKLIEVMIYSPTDDHFDALGIRLISVGPRRLSMKMDYKESLVGNPDTGVIHGGAITTLLDTTCGFAAATVLGHLGLTPTIDLRIDYMRPAEPFKAIVGEAEVYRNTKNVIFTRGVAHQGDVNKPIAHAVGNFVNMGSKTFRGFRETILEAHETLKIPHD